ncbi:Putative UPF0496 protein 2 [Apostasia shenzhenica]|uniref:UPF0496 protein 2 n=1 Tax=Apostasia shenzhenica TaxID=1088818 RepID=A0A2I0A3U8_9ASPA|nr:Putative UPF0496 protein 2 [Apostasia shenzhenica]
MARCTRGTLELDAEYTEAFHTNSFVDIWSKAHRQLKLNSSAAAAMPPPQAYIPPSSPPRRSYSHLPDFLLEPRQADLLAAAACAGGNEAILVDYLDATFQSFTACASLLDAIDRARYLRRAICRLLPCLSSSSSAAAELSSRLDLGNPFSPPHLTHFYSTHALYLPLVRRLGAARRRLWRRARLLRVAKSTSGVMVITAVVAAAIAAVALAVHAAAALSAAAATPLVAAGWRRLRWAAEGVRLGRVERAARRVDAAARGAYIVRRDLDTLSRMVQRAHDEAEHGREVAAMALRCGEDDEVIREVVREMEVGEQGFKDKVEELEEHVYLCLLTINRSRRLVAEELKEEEDGS